MPLRPSVLTGLLIAMLAAGLGSQAPTPRPTAPSGASLPGVGPAPQPQPPATATAATATGIIRGRVTRADIGKPLRKVVIIVNPDNTRENRVATTDAEGRYELKALPPGPYVLAASRGDFVGLQYGQRRPGDSARTLQLAPGQTIDRVDFTLIPGGVIAGTVVDDAGEPLARVVVEALTPRYVQGVRQLVASNTKDVTDDLGQFRLFGLAQGEWVVKATSPDQPPDVGGLNPLPSKGTVTYYPGTHAAAEARNVQLDAGSEVTGLTIAVVPERLATIVGMVRTSDGGVMPRGGMVSIAPLKDSENATLGTLILPDGSFAIPNLPPGRYMVAAQLGGATITEGAVTEVALDGANVSVDLTLYKTSSARGRFAFDTEAPPPALMPASVRVSTEPTPPRILASILRPTPARNDWTFELPELIGPRQLRVTLPQGWAVDSIRLDGRDITDRPLDFAGKDIDGIVVHLTQHVSAVRGQVSDQRGQKVTDASVVLFADDRAKWTPGTRFVRAVRADGDGRFDARGLPAGRYLAVALEFLEPGEETNPEMLEQLRGLGIPFTLDAEGTAIVNVKVSPAP